MNEANNTEEFKEINNKLSKAEAFQLRAEAFQSKTEAFQLKAEAFQSKTEAFQLKTEALQTKTEAFQIQTTKELSRIGVDIEELKDSIQTIYEAVATFLKKSEEDSKLKD